MPVPLAIVITVGVLVTPAHVPVLAPAMVTLAGMVSVNAAPSVIGTVLPLPIVIVNGSAAGNDRRRRDGLGERQRDRGQ